MFNLNFNGVEIFQEKRCIGRFEEWQEGYVDSAYSRDLLSKGMRLVLSNEFLTILLRECKLSLVVSQSEAREEKRGFGNRAPKARGQGVTTLQYIPQG